MTVFARAAKTILLSVLTLLLLLAPASASFGQIARPAIVDPPFFRPVLDPQGAALAGSPAPTGSPSSTVLYANPAALTLLGGSGHASLGYARWQGISYVLAASALQPGDGRYGTFGLTLTDGHYQNAHLARGASLGYAHWIHEHLSLGVRLKYRFVQRRAFSGDGPTRLSTVNEHAGEADLALLFSVRPDVYRVTAVAMDVLPHQWELWRGKSNVVTLPARFNFGGAVNAAGLLPDLFAEHEAMWLTTGLQFIPDHHQIGAGVEYVWRDRLYLRAGYGVDTGENMLRSRIREGAAQWGIGLGQPIYGVRLRLDYAFEPYGSRGGSHRVTGSVSM